MKLPKLLLLASMMSPILATSSYAAPYPAGVTLDETQEITLNNGAEVTSIDPAKQAAEPAFNLGRDLFEGLVIQDKQGKTIPVLLSLGQSMTTIRFIPSTYVMQNGQMAKRSLHKILSTAGNAY